jgi:ferredoxin
MARPMWFVAILKKVFPGRVLLAELTKVPVAGSIVDHMLFRGDDIVYLPRNEVIPVGEPLEAPKEMVLPSQVVEHFVQEAGYHWIMDACICRDASRCEDYPRDLGCLFLGEAVLGIHPRLGRLVTREEALAHLGRCREAGLVHMVGRNRLDTFWMGVGPGDRLLTICNCCPCCCLWKVLPHITPEIGDKVTRMPGVSVSVTDRCVACGVCTQGVCFVEAISLDGDRAVIDDACRGCGRCVTACPHQAIELTIDDEQFVRKTIERLAPLVDVT